MIALRDMLDRDLDEAYETGAEDGFWAGYSAGVWAMTRAVRGEEVDLAIPAEFQPGGHRFFTRDFAREREERSA